MNTDASHGAALGHRAEISRRQLASLAGTIAIAAGVGTWAYFFPRGFYDHFPWVLGEWISQDGPFNEHLIRDHGAQYLGLGTASVAAWWWRSQEVFRVLAIAWALFGVLHAGYHVTHLDHLSTRDATAMVTVLVVAVLLGLGIGLRPSRGVTIGKAGSGWSRRSRSRSSGSGSPS